MINSASSVMADSEISGGQNDVDDTLSMISDSEALNDSNNGQARRRGWSLFNRGAQNNNGDAPADADGTPRRVKALSLTCRLKGTAKVSCLITCSSIAELIGNLLALVYGIAFIQGACNFYELESSTEQKAKEYDEKLDEVLFLQRNRVGFVGLLATCLVGLIVSFLMPLGTVYRSWKSLRAAMSLLFSMILAHLILAIIYLTNTVLMASLAVIPFRIYEIFLIYSHIRAYKKKKRDEAMKAAADNVDELGSATNSQNLLRSASLNNLDQNKGSSGQNAKQLSSDMQLGFNFSSDKLAKQADEDNDNGGKKRSKERKSSKKRKLAVSWQGERKNRQAARNNDLPTENYK